MFKLTKSVENERFSSVAAGWMTMKHLQRVPRIYALFVFYSYFSLTKSSHFERCDFPVKIHQSLS